MRVQTTLQTVIGQNLDLVTAPTDRVDFSSFSIERYNAIVKYKTAFYSFYLPVACAMYMVCYIFIVDTCDCPKYW